MIIHKVKIFPPLFFLFLFQIQTRAFNITNYGAEGNGSKLFLPDIPKFIAQKVNGLTIDDFQLSWTGTRIPFFTHGIDVSDLSGLCFSNFVGTASSINKTAFPICFENGKQANVDKNVGVKNPLFGQIASS